MPAKRPRLSGGAPEVHVAVNIAPPLPGKEASYTVNTTTHHIDKHPLSSQGTPSEPKKLGASPQMCAATSTPERPNPPVRLLLELMDIDDPAPDMQYVSMEEELVEMGMPGIREVYKMPVELLATFGCLGIGGATRLHAYIKERLLPVIGPAQDEGVVSGEKSVKLEGTDGKGKGKRLVKEESQDVIVEWPSDEQDPLGEDEIDDSDELPPIEVLEDEDDVESEISGYDTL